MGVRNWLHNKRMTDPVDGTIQLTGCSVADSSASHSTCRVHGVVTGPGVGPVAVEHRCMAPVKKWPQPGQTLPVVIDRADPTRLEIRWDDIAGNRDRAFEAAEQLAASMGQPAQSRQAKVSVLGAAGRALPGAAGGGLTPEQAASGTGLVPATARVLAVHDVAVPAGTAGVGAGGLVDLTLDVTMPTGGYATSMRIGFSTPERRALVAEVGRELPVLVDPAARDRIAVDTARLLG